MIELLTKVKKNKGFTLAELMVVVAIIAVLAGIMVVGIIGRIEEARMARVKSWATTVQTDLAGFEVGTWKFDEGTGTTVRDTSWKGNHGTMHNFTSPHGFSSDTPHDLIGAGAGRYSLSFDVVDRVLVPDPGTSSLDLDEVTMELWVNWYGGINHDGWMRLVWKGETYELFVHAGNRHAHFCIRIDDVVRRRYCINGRVGGVPAGQWAHLVGVFNRERMVLYVNGERQPQERVVSGVIIDNNHNLHIGGIGNPAWWARFRGLIDEVRIYSRALKAYEIQDRYVKGIKSLHARGIITEDDFNNRVAQLENYITIK